MFTFAVCLLQASARPCKKVLSQTGNVLTSNFHLQAHILSTDGGVAQALCHDVRLKRGGGLQLQNLHYQQRMHKSDPLFPTEENALWYSWGATDVVNAAFWNGWEQVMKMMLPHQVITGR